VLESLGKAMTITQRQLDREPNMKKSTAILSGLVAFLGTAAALAAGWNTGSIYVTKIEVGGSPTETFLTFSATPNNKPAGCTSAQAYVSTSNEQIRTVATAALLSGTEVRIYWDATCKSGTTYGQISRIELVR